MMKNIDAIEFKQTGAYCLLILRCKDFQVHTLQMPVSSEARNILYSLEKLKDIGEYKFLSKYAIYNEPYDFISQPCVLWCEF